jgi:hypothetical protein
MNKRIGALLVVGMLSMSVVGCTSTVEEPQVHSTTEKVEEQIVEKAEQELNIVLVDNEAITMTLIATYEDEMFGEVGYKTKIENKTDKAISINSDSTSVNGVMNDPIFTTSIEPNKTAYVNFYWWTESDLNPNVKCIEDLVNIEGKLDIVDTTNDEWNHLYLVDFVIE